MQFKFHTLDVFTDTRFGGNPLAVVHGADGLSGETMQAIAAEFNLSETVFVMKPAAASHSAKIRIFTPAMELPFAGHPTVGTGALLAELRAADVGGGGDALVILEEQIGLLRVGVKMGSANGTTFAEFDAPKIPEAVDEVPPLEDIAVAVGLIPGEIGFSNHRPMVFEGGARFLYLPVASRSILAKAAPNLKHWGGVFKDLKGIGVYLYCNQPEHMRAHFRARMFAPDHGIMEDPATGSAAAVFAGVIQHFDKLPDGVHKRLIEQGYEMGRPSNIVVSLEVERGVLAGVRIGGHCVRVSDGMLTI
ncbi:MAG: PhzF family phenazine biosynthesis protein [Alphaproteobacteria bacterium]|nr:PhzF family phenazine biosynthesis protein [Alphaproteobacteria bacterium]